MIFSLDVRRARKGDCLLLHFGTKDEPGLVMIDGGPKERLRAAPRSRGSQEIREGARPRPRQIRCRSIC